MRGFFLPVTFWLKEVEAIFITQQDSIYQKLCEYPDLPLLSAYE